MYGWKKKHCFNICTRCEISNFLVRLEVSCSRPFKKEGSLAIAARAVAILRDGYFDSYVSEARKKKRLGGRKGENKIE